MKRTAVGLAFLFALVLIPAVGSGHESPVPPQAVAQDLSKDPRLQQLVDVHLKRALVAELTDNLKKHTDQHFVIAVDVQPLMVCVFAEKQPLWKIMKGVADVLCCTWTDRKTEWRLAFDPTAKNNLQKYKAAEASVLREDEFQRAKALADLVAKKPFSATANPEASQEVPEDVTPQQWAQSRVGERAFYAAGEMFLHTPLLERNDDVDYSAPATDRKWDALTDFTKSNQMQSFTLGPPQNSNVARTYMRFQLDPEQPLMTGAQIVFRSLPWAGTFECVDVDTGQHKAILPKRLLARPIPTGALAKYGPGKWLLDWRTPLADAKDTVLDAQISELKPKSTFFKKALGIEDYLEALHEATHATVISDAFRVPIIPSDSLLNAGSVRDWLKRLQESQKCFIKTFDNAVEIRHGGFWDLRSFEPDEQEIRDFERIKNPDLDDYADLAIKLEDPYLDYGFLWPLPEFLLTAQTALTRFDPKPLQDSFPVLLAYGQMNREARLRVLKGDVFDSMVVKRDVSQHRVLQPVTGRDQQGRRKTYIYDMGIDTKIHEVGDLADYYLDASAPLSIFEGGLVEGKEKVILEISDLQKNYLDLTGRFPLNDGEEGVLFDHPNICHAHLFMLGASPTFPPEELEDPDKKVLYGTFKFLSGFSNQDGVLSQVDIPQPVAAGRG